MSETPKYPKVRMVYRPGDAEVELEMEFECNHCEMASRTRERNEKCSPSYDTCEHFRYPNVCGCDFAQWKALKEMSRVINKKFEAFNV